MNGNYVRFLLTNQKYLPTYLQAKYSPESIKFNIFTNSLLGAILLGFKAQIYFERTITSKVQEKKVEARIFDKIYKAKYLLATFPRQACFLRSLNE